MSEKTTVHDDATTGLDFAMVLVQDMTRARAFYETVLGLPAAAEMSEAFVEYELPDGNTFAIAKAPEGMHQQLGGLMFAVPDVDAAVERVKANGGTFFTNFGGTICTSGWCADPDGNPFGVHRRFAAAL
jgi:predicted enzyme related to lactoylglutathione lyase